MNTAQLETKDAKRYAWAAANNARMKNAVNSSLYTDAEKLKAERMKIALDYGYFHKGIYINYRKTKITIKVNAARIKDRKLIRELEDGWDFQSITKARTEQGIIYSIKK